MAAYPLRRGMRRAVLTLCVVLALIVGVLTPPGRAQVDPDCVAAVPTDRITVGMTGSGLTVQRGNTPEPFGAEVLGVLRDGIAPGIDMIVVNLDSPAIDANGVWAGMSGSPVYAADGRLIGAVAYVLTLSASTIAGLTPAETMLDLYDYPASSAGLRTADEVALPAAVRRRAAAASDATPRELREGMSRLPLPVGVSSLRPSRLETFENRLGRDGDLMAFQANAAPPAPGDVDDIFPGSNFAAALSYGDLSVAGVGTTTDVCEGAALAFGHPFLWVGRTALSAHSADAIVIQPDPTFGSFKVANQGGVVGTVDQDRLAGLRAQLGAGPDPSVVRSRVRSTSTNRQRTGRTWVNRSTDVPDIAAFHVLANFDRVLDKIGEGRVQLTWTATGTRGAGRTWKLTRRNRFADQFDVSFASIFEMLDWLSIINTNKFTRVTFDRVDVTASVNEAYQRLRLGTVRVAVNGGAFRRITAIARLNVRTGDTIRVRVPLIRYREQSPSNTINLRMVVPRRLGGQSVRLGVFGGASLAGEIDVFSGTSFADILSRMRRTESNHDVVARLSRPRGNAGPQVFRKDERSVGNVVFGRRSVAVRVR